MDEISERFVGRQEELKSFRRMLDNPYGSERVRYVSGPGGIGKTWLAKKMLAEAEQHPKGYLAPTLFDMYATNSRHIKGIIDAIVEGLKKLEGGDVFASYDAKKVELVKAQATLGYSPDGLEMRMDDLRQAFRECLHTIVKKQPIILVFDTFEHVHHGDVGNWILNDNGLQMEGVLCIIAGRELTDQPELGGLSRSEVFEFYVHHYNLNRELSKDEQKDLEAVLEKTGNEEEGYNPLFLGLTLDMFPGSFEELTELSQMEYEQRIANWLGPDYIGSIYNMPSRFNEPIGLLLICMAYLNRRFNRFFLDKLIAEKFITDITSAELWDELQLRLPEFFFVKERQDNEIQLHDKLAELIRLYNFPYAFGDSLTGQRQRELASFVVAWYGELISQENNIDSAAILRAEQLSYILEYDVLADIQRPDYKETKEAFLLRQRLPPDFSRAKLLLQQYTQKHSYTLNRLIIAELSPEFFDVAPTEEQYVIFSSLGQMAREIHDLKYAQIYWQRAASVATDQENSEQQIDALLGVYMATWPEDLTAALVILQEAAAICDDKMKERSPTVLYWTALTYRRMQDLEKAIQYYTEALDMASQYEDKNIMPTILNDMGYALLLTGKYKQAQAWIEMAARFREENRDDCKKEIAAIVEKRAQIPIGEDAYQLTLQKDVLEAQLYEATRSLGRSYNTLGELFRYQGVLDRATGYYAEALAIFKKLNAYYWQVMALNGLGEAHRQLASNLASQERQEKSQYYDGLASANIESSLKLCRDYGFVEISARGYRRMGRLLHDRFFRTDNPKEEDRWLAESLKYLNEGLQVARDRKDVLEELEILAEIAFLGDDHVRIYKERHPGKSLPVKKRKEIENNHVGRLRKGIKRHKEDERLVYHFRVFENLLKMEEAALKYESDNYDKALNGYLDSFTGLAQELGYGSARCHRHFNHLLECIRRLPDNEERKRWCERFVSRWEKTMTLQDKSQTVAEAHPDLFEKFSLYIEVGFMFS